MKITKPFLLIFMIFPFFVYSQSRFSGDPLQAQFVTEDVDSFWKAYDIWKKEGGNPFKEYVENGTLGVKGFLQSRIENADSLLAMVKRHEQRYLDRRNSLQGLAKKRKQIQAAYASIKYWYPEVKFPPVYFVVGRFNSGGTVSDDGIIIGAEKLSSLDWIKELVTHELVHFQQKYEGPDNLLKQAIKEGSADFIAELASGEQNNLEAFMYGEAHEDELKKEFALLMEGDDNTDWLYSTSGKDNRPNDLGYWIGYKITEAYWKKQTDKHKAMQDIMRVKDPKGFLLKSQYLDDAIAIVNRMSEVDKTILKYKVSKETFPIKVMVKVPNITDEVYISGYQPQLGNAQPNKVKFNKVDEYTRVLEVKVHSPARFVLTNGSWSGVGVVKGTQPYETITVLPEKESQITYQVTRWVSWE